MKAARWFADHAGEYRVDSERLITIGTSAGGHMALLLGMLPRESILGPYTKIAAVIGLFGPKDLTTANHGPGQQMRAVGWLKDENTAKTLSPLTYVRRDLPPIFVVHDDRDETVPYDRSLIFRAG